MPPNGSISLKLTASSLNERRCADAVFIFIAPPSWEALETRLTKRGTEPIEIINERLAKARNEIMAIVDKLGELHTVSSFSDNIEIMSEKASKGNAVKAICDIIGCTAENAMTFGDAWNDCSMLEFAEHSFAMENGDEKCKNSAKNICPSK